MSSDARRTINGNAGRDHWARCWSVVVGGGESRRVAGRGATDDDGRQVITEPYSAEDLMATVCSGSWGFRWKRPIKARMVDR